MTIPGLYPDPSVLSDRLPLPALPTVACGVPVSYLPLRSEATNTDRIDPSFIERGFNQTGLVDLFLWGSAEHKSIISGCL